jgi:hypothetical protein
MLTSSGCRPFHHLRQRSRRVPGRGAPGRTRHRVRTSAARGTSGPAPARGKPADHRSVGGGIRGRQRHGGARGQSTPRPPVRRMAAPGGAGARACRSPGSNRVEPVSRHLSHDRGRDNRSAARHQRSQHLRAAARHKAARRKAGGGKLRATVKSLVGRTRRQASRNVLVDGASCLCVSRYETWLPARKSTCYGICTRVNPACCRCMAWTADQNTGRARAFTSAAYNLAGERPLGGWVGRSAAALLLACRVALSQQSCTQSAKQRHS